MAINRKNKVGTEKKISATKPKHLKVATCDLIDLIKASMLTEHNENITIDKVVNDACVLYAVEKKLPIKIPEQEAA